MLSKTALSTQPYKCTIGCFAGNFDSFSSSDLDPDCLISMQDVQTFERKHSRKLRKTKFQIEVLLHAFDRRRLWTREEIDLLSEQTGLSTGQVYKWNWDFRKKKKRQGVIEASWLRDLHCTEVIKQSALDKDLYQLVTDYKLALATKKLQST